MEWAQPFPLYLHRGRDPQGQQVRNNEVFDSFLPSGCKAAQSHFVGHSPWAAPWSQPSAPGTPAEPQQGVPATPQFRLFPAAQVLFPTQHPEFLLLRGVPCPQTCSSGCLLDVFVSECCSVNVTHCVNPGNNAGSSQHPKSFPAPNVKIHSWGTSHLLLLLSLFPVWSWLRAASRKITRADNVFYPGVHWRIISEKYNLPSAKKRNQIILFILHFSRTADFSPKFT